MTGLFAGVLFIHGLIHLFGFAKAFGLAALPQLSQPISSVFGILWLIAGALFICTAGSLFLLPRWWWALGAAAIALSMVLVISSWTDARFGAAANLVVLLGVAFGFLAQGPTSLRASYESDVDRALARPPTQAPVTERDLGRLPPPVQRYLRATGVAGHPRVHNFRVRMRGRIRAGPDARWMPIEAEQYNFMDTPSRLFYLTASMFMVPLQGYHRYVGPSATMRVKAAALLNVVDAAGQAMDKGETVTMFNDMCVFAPATLIDSAITWEAVDAHTVKASFANAGHTIRAELSFNEAGELVDFWSDDRPQIGSDGQTAKHVRWSTPIDGYRSFGPFHLASGGAARWHESTGDYSYIELEFNDVQYNVLSRR
jgi:hypothetical protein